jgi:hypothetical protein
MNSQVPKAFRDDSVAASAAWTPLVTGGNGIRTHQLTLTSSQRAEMTLTGLMRWIPWILGGVGTVQGIFGIYFGRRMADGAGLAELLEKGNYIPLLIGVTSVMGIVIAVGLAGYFYWRSRCPVVFDRKLGWYWKGSKSPDTVSNPASLSTAARLDQIHALQIIDEYVVNQDKEVVPYHSYELNLVLADGDRRNVLDHSGLTTLRHDAEMLGEFLDVPIWDAVREPRRGKKK